MFGYDRIVITPIELRKKFELISDYCQAGNSGQLDVKINDTKLLYNGDVADIAQAQWQQWHIDLASVAGLENVTALTIGIEGANATGMLYIDDIRLYP